MVHMDGEAVTIISYDVYNMSVKAKMSMSSVVIFVGASQLNDVNVNMCDVSIHVIIQSILQITHYHILYHKHIANIHDNFSTI